MTTSDYLTQLQQDKSDLVDNLTEMGIEGLTGEETFTELVPEVLNIQGGADLSEYFNDNYTFSIPTNGYGIVNLIKKLPPFYINMASISYLFRTATELEEVDLLYFTYNYTQMVSLFDSCKNLTTIKNLDKLNTSNVTTMEGMFAVCNKLTNLDLSTFDTSNVTNMSYMFYQLAYTSSFTYTLNMNFDMGKVNNVNTMFDRCPYLVNLTFGYDLGKGYTQQTEKYNNYKLTLSSCTNLTHDSLMSVINNLYDLNLTYDVANGGTLYRQSLVLGNTNLAKLTAEEIQIATDKGWLVS